MTRHFFLLVLLLGWYTQSAAQEVIGVVKNASDDKPIPTVHVLNLNKVLMSITDANGVFAIDAEVNDTYIYPISALNRLTLLLQTT